jgi:O-acetyl-ADP-ribose deacetylase (regulator of RNase III)
MIYYNVGNLLDVTEGIIVHGCNRQGVMGSGVAKAVKSKYPGAFDQYVKDLEQWRNDGRSGMGMISWYEVNDKLRIASGITQKTYGRSDTFRFVSYDAIDDIFKCVGEIARKEQKEIHIPLIGAGLGNGDWGVILEIIYTRTVGVSVAVWELDNEI